jgi:UPF0716 protein FxsA
MIWFVLFLLWPVAELFVAIKVAEAVGVLLMLVLLVAGWPLGTWAIRSQGRAVARRLATAIAEGRTPARETLDGVLVLIGGGLLMLPGFLTDVAGLFLLLPPTRALARIGVVRNLRSRLVVRAVGFTAGRQPYDVDSTAVDVNQPRLGS